jgi:cytochrome c553
MKSTCDTAAEAGFGQGSVWRNGLEMCRSIDLMPVGAGATRQSFSAASRLCRAMLITLAASAALPGAVAMAVGDATAGAEKAYTCLGCHGVDHYVNTYPTYHVPRIAGQHPEYLISALQAYRAKTRSHPTMQANANLLTDQDIEDIAAWLSTQGAK